MSSEHPSDAVLAVWLETGQPSSVDDHVATCGECTARLDASTELGSLHQDLAVATSPPSDLEDRLTVGVRGRLAAQEAVSVLVEMLALPLRTAAVLIGGDEPARRGVTTLDAMADETHDDDGERRDG